MRRVDVLRLVLTYVLLTKYMECLCGEVFIVKRCSQRAIPSFIAEAVC